ncbi:MULTISPECIES: purine-nucleoside phosphorylase [unclassified Candidatus Frackibacter]|uniref:purine-nucleoside phosphorylase n=1 Tax=unclassified Candidatus Frackibacter TaxID=2648818 RepID=UPI00088D2557|nr:MULTISPECIES: purine-nucleoside phosphorylase [unclassified Candidatus Frackibacter]SDC02037.1 purine-nucleoside phosphorylase [Candidatus Frackibacter sp. WG11]SEM33246.1 purine-nucleoside phosphorylase [Candidatus Frackibacter sp. WG12]SFL38256.1 purine-nucleoside phosphorylase [Candidatus Frackibacter sp. WG13]
MDLKAIEESVEYLKEASDSRPDIAMILGSGLGVLAEEIEDATIVKYDEIPNFPTSTVDGHAGQLVLGKLEGKNVIAMQGRFHYYEGYAMSEVVFPVRVMNLLGAKKLLVTNSAGGVNRNYNVGDLMIINDHINFMGTNPLIGANQEELGPRFPDMSMPYNEELIDLAEQVAEDKGINTRKGVYLAMTGPSYETPAEIRMISRLGADAVGMSTVPEVITAKHMGMNVLGISCITNMAAGILAQPLDHNEVIETTKRVKSKFITLVREIVSEI